ncbi:MAG: divalent-cation tolerance protein CutA [Nitrospirae bacterium]|nr:divalent-cation tolerance protein CutA [Nitrospirota bacterium]
MTAEGSPEYIAVLITAPDEQEAVRIAEGLVSERLAGCVNIVRNVRSIYRWEGKTEDSTEVLMIAKTRRELFDPLVKKVRELHSYKVPEVIALPVMLGFDDYLGWLRQETGPIT